MANAAQTIPGGRLIFFDGIDGVGKTTQLKKCQRALEADGWLVKTGRINGGTAIGEALRSVMLADLPRPAGTDLHIVLAMYYALIEQIDTWREAGAVALIDRSPLSIMAYQVGGDGLAPEHGWQMVSESMMLFRPDLTLVFTAEVETALSRARAKRTKADYFDAQPLAYFDRAQVGYRAAAERCSATVIDANQSIERVQAQTWQAIEKVLPSDA